MKWLNDLAGIETSSIVHPLRLGIGLIIVGLAPLLPFLQWAGG